MNNTITFEEFKLLLQEKKEYYSSIYTKASIVDNVVKGGTKPYIWFSLSERGFNNITFTKDKIIVEGDISTERLALAIELGKAWLAGASWQPHCTSREELLLELYNTGFDPNTMYLV